MQFAKIFLAEFALCAYSVCTLHMITSIQLTITEGPSLPLSTLEGFAAIAEESGKTPEQFLMELIRAEVEAKAAAANPTNPKAA